MDDSFLIECMENEFENSYFDFKKDIYDFNNLKSKENFLVDVLSFANSHSKGDKYIITGIKLLKDNLRTFYGITESKIKDGADYQSLVNDNIEPNIIVDFKVVEYDGNKYGIFRINKDNVDTPYLISKQYGNLQKGFIKIRKGQKNEFIGRKDFDLFYTEKSTAEYSDIYIKGVINKKANNKFIVKKFTNEFNAVKAKNDIYDLFVRTMEVGLERSSDNFNFGSKLVLDDEYINSISSYAKENGISLPSDFFDIGNMTYFSLGYYAGTTFYGSDTERQKYNLLCSLGEKIGIIQGLINFYDNIDKLYYTELLLQNIGKKFDEDIEVTLKIRKDAILEFNKFPVPSQTIIEKMLENNYLHKYLENQKINGVNTYTSKTPIIPPIYPTDIKLPIGYSQVSYEDYVDYYKDYIQTLANYEISDDENYCYLKFNQKEIKPNELIHLPSRIIFVKQLDIIEYEIKTKHNPNTKIGKILNEDSK